MLTYNDAFQINTVLRRHTIDIDVSPEHRLWFAIIEQAINDVCSIPSYTTVKTKQDVSDYYEQFPYHYVEKIETIEKKTKKIKTRYRIYLSEFSTYYSEGRRFIASEYFENICLAIGLDPEFASMIIAKKIPPIDQKH